MNDLESEITQLESMLAEIPPNNLVNRIGLENRLANVKSMLLGNLREENARLKAELAECKRVIVEVAIPLEAMVSAGTHRLQSESVANGIETSVTLIREVISKGCKK